MNESADLDPSNGEAGVWGDEDSRDPLCSYQDEGPINISDNEDDRDAESVKGKKGQYYFQPSIAEVTKAHNDLREILKPQQTTGYGFVEPDLNRLVKEQLFGMKLFCHNFIEMQAHNPGSLQWIAASLQTAKSLDSGVYMA